MTVHHAPPSARSDQPSAANPAPATPPRRWLRTARRFGPIALIALGLALVFATGLHREISLETLRENYEQWRGWAEARPFSTALCFILIYALAASISLPGALWFTIAGGLLFGWFQGAVYSWLGATIGATLLFVAARTALRGVLEAKAGPRVQQFKAGFERDAFSYLLTLRLIPLPFFLVNAAPAFFDVKIRTFVAASMLGMIPGAFAYATLGAGAGEIIAEGGQLALGSVLFEPKVLIAMGMLAMLAFIPIILRRLGVLGDARG